MPETEADKQDVQNQPESAEEDLLEQKPSEDQVDRDLPKESTQLGTEEAPELKPEGESEPLDVVPDVEITTSAVIEAVLFSTDEPIHPKKLAEIVNTGGVKEIRAHIEELNRKYEENHSAFRIENIAGGFQMLTLPQFNAWLKKLIKVRSESKLSPAALETLAIIAYKQPILRVDIEKIRGVACGEMVRQLTDKGMVKIVGRAEELGRPLLYGTTKRFLEVFGLNSLKDLPSAEDLKKPELQ